jgi:putative transcriptional regulator
MSKHTTIARIRPDGRIVRVQAHGSEETLPAGPIPARTAAQIEAAAADDRDNRPLTSAEIAKLRRVPRAKTLRRALGLTQEEFAARYQIPVGTLRDWEQGRTEPDQAARAYLNVIAHDPQNAQSAPRTEATNSAQAKPASSTPPVKRKQRRR